MGISRRLGSIRFTVALGLLAGACKDEDDLPPPPVTAGGRDAPVDMGEADAAADLGEAADSAQATPITGTVIGYTKRITIDRNNVGDPATTSLADYPMLFSVVDPDLRSWQSGGNVRSSLAEDIRFEADDAETCAGTAPCTLDHEVEAYDGTNGTLVAWVRVPVLNGPRSDRNTVLRIRYGGPDPAPPAASAQAVWQGFSGVWHFTPRPGQPLQESQDSTRNAHHGPPSEPNRPRTSEGFIGRARNSSSPFAIPDHDSLDLSDSGYVSLWCPEGIGPVVTKGPRSRAFEDRGTMNYALQLTVGGGIAFEIGDGMQTFWAGGDRHKRDAGSSAYYHLAVVWDRGSLSVYDDGVLRTPPSTLPFTPASNALPLVIGAFADGPGSFGPFLDTFGGKMDELRISKTPHGAARIATDFRNQRDPGTFFRLGPEEAIPHSGPQLSAYTKRLTIDRQKVGDEMTTSLANYPLLFATVDPDLRALQAGGRLWSPRGNDVRFQADSAETCRGAAPCTLDHEIEAYDGNTGTLVAWVRVPVLNGPRSAGDTVIRIRYGGPDRAAPPAASAQAVWREFSAVWHFTPKPGQAELQGQDSTSNANHGSPSERYKHMTFPGPIGLSADILHKETIVVPDSDSLDLSSSGQVSLWYATSFFYGALFSKGPRTTSPADAAGLSYALEFVRSGALFWRLGDGTLDLLVAPEPGTQGGGRDDYHHVAVAWDQQTIRVYRDGVQAQTAPVAPATPLPNDLPLVIGDYTVSAEFVRRYLGKVDELRISKIPQPSAWIATDVRSQRDPGSFVRVGPEEMVGQPGN